MPDLIDREALSSQIDDAVQKYDPYDSCQNKIIQEIMKISELIDDAPTFAPESLVKHGRWVEYENEADKGFHYCSVCRGQAFNYEDGQKVVEVLANYCPNCGAKMDLEDL